MDITTKYEIGDTVYFLNDRLVLTHGKIFKLDAEVEKNKGKLVQSVGYYIKVRGDSSWHYHVERDLSLVPF